MIMSVWKGPHMRKKNKWERATFKINYYTHIKYNEHTRENLN